MQLIRVLLLPPPITPVTRPPSPAENLPAKPKVNIELYPDPAKWYNFTSDFLVKWDLPNDITGVSIFLNDDSQFTPLAKSDGLFDSQIFPVLQDGIHYLHIRFQNQIGWGPTTHYRIAIDTVPPVPFEISSSEGTQTDNPTPVLDFIASDGLSGVRDYLIKVDNGAGILAEDNATALPILAPGRHTIIVRASDNANNIRESNIEIEILPIASPKISVFNKNVFVGEDDLIISGTALPNIGIIIIIKDNKNGVAAQRRVETDETGDWGVNIDEFLKKGQYTAEIKAKDSRGAESLPIIETINVRERPILVIGGLEITQSWFFLTLITLLAGGFGAGWFAYRVWREQLGRKVTVAQRDVINALASVEKDIDKILKNYVDKQIDEREASEMEFVLKNMKEKLNKAERYIIENIKEINE